MADMDRLRQQMEFILELDKSKGIMRQTYKSDGELKENDAEHSWHLAVMAMVLCEYANEPVDVAKVMAMVILHDVVEIDAGDTYAYDVEGHKDKREREEKAAQRIFGLLPKGQGTRFQEIWEEFDEGKTPEAKFARSLDRLQPLMLNDATGGKAWREHGVHETQVRERNPREDYGADALWEFAMTNYIDKNVENGNLIRDGK